MGRLVKNGALAGIAGGIVFGALMAMMGMLPMIARLAGSSSSAVGMLLHLVISAVIGAGFALLLGRFLTGMGQSLVAGIIYGMFWWFLGPLTLMPLMMEMGTQWNTAAMAKQMPSLMGHMIYGAVLGLTFVWLSRRGQAPVEPRHA